MHENAAAPEHLIKEFGEQYRDIIIDALKILSENKAKWKIGDKFSERDYIARLIERVAKP